MIRRERADLGGPRHRGLRNVGKRKGWTGLSRGAYIAYQTISQGPKARELTNAKVLKNRPAEQNALVQPHKAVWRQVRVCHFPLYTTEEGAVTMELTESVLEESVRYSAMKCRWSF